MPFRSVPKRLKLPALDADPLANELYMTPAELAERWSVHLGTLANRRSKRLPPRFVKLDKHVIYPLSAILEFERANTIQPGRKK